MAERKPRFFKESEPLDYHPQIEEIAEEFIRLCFALEEHCPGYINAYFGPQKLKDEGTSLKKPLSQIRKEASSLISKIEKIERTSETPRTRNLKVHLRSMVAKADLLDGNRLTFYQESQALYDAAPPEFPFESFEETLSRLDSLIPGRGTLLKKFSDLKQEFIVPAEKLEPAIKTAIQEARKKTSNWIPLPEGEEFSVEIVSGKPWSGYNWFEGNAQSLIQINSDLPVYLDTVITLACHEGYPGHHVFNCFREQELYLKKGWVEFSIFPLFGPDALFAEGSANFGVEMVFPSLSERVDFAREVLCPITGIDPGRLELYEEALSLVRKLAYVQVEVARRYLDGLVCREEALELLQKFRLQSPEEAEHSLKFIEFYRSYVINYKLGEDLVRAFVEGDGGTPENPEKRWSIFFHLLINPILPSDLTRLKLD